MARNLLSIQDFSDQELDALTRPDFTRGAAGGGAPVTIRGTLAFLFQQPSLRTMSSFASAGASHGLAPVVLNAFGGVRDACEMHDEIRQLSLTSSMVVVRSATALQAANVDSLAPVVNAGDGTNEHPSQTLVDVAVMRSLGLASGKKVVLMGNMRDHRVHHSLSLALERLDADVRLVSPAEMAMPERFRARACVAPAMSVDQVDAALAEADFVYLSPMLSHQTAEHGFGSLFSLDLARARRVLKSQAKVLHPFPRHGELATDVDGTPFDAYHLQTAAASCIRARMLGPALAG
jgi:aspartate carbamoyltransferase catalytic subunit